MADFPNNIFNGRQLDNVTGVSYDVTKLTRFYAEDHNALIDEIEAIETTLGENPEGAYTTVKEWLEALEAGGGGGGSPNLDGGLPDTVLWGGADIDGGTP